MRKIPRRVDQPYRLFRWICKHLVGDTTTTLQKSLKFRSFLPMERLSAAIQNIYPLPTSFSRTFSPTLCKDTLTQHSDSYAMISSAQPKMSFEMSRPAIQTLENHTCLGGIEYRFAWEGRAGLIKIVPLFEHDSITDGVTRIVDLTLFGMGLVSTTNRKWVATTTYKPTTNKGKQGMQNITLLVHIHVIYRIYQRPNENNKKGKFIHG